MSLKTKLAVAVSALFVLFVAVVAGVALFFFEREFTATVESQQNALVSAVAESIDEKFAIAQTSLLAAAGHLPPEGLSSAAEAQRFLDHRVTLHAIFDNVVFLLDPQGRLIAESPYLPGRRGKDLSGREYFRRTVATGRPYISNHYISTHTPGHPAVVMTVPLFDSRGTVIGIFGGSLDLLGDNFLRHIPDTKIGKGGYLYVIGADRVLVAHPDQKRVMQVGANPGVNRMLDRALEGFNGSGITVNSNGVEMLASFRHLRSNDWILAANFPTAEAYAPLYKARRNLLWGAMVCAAAMLVAAWLLMRRLTQPLSEMTAHVTGLHRKSGEDKLIAIDSSDEIGMLARAFNGMVSVEERQREALRKAMVAAENERQRWEATLAALGEGVAVLDRNFRVTFQNDIHMHLVGDHVGEFCYRSFEQKPDICPDCPVAACFADGRIHSAERAILTATGPKCVVITASPLRDASGEIVAGIEVVRDMTERKRVEQEIVALNAGLKQQAQELAATNRELEAFSYSLSHDLRSPLTLITGSADILLQDYRDTFRDDGKFFLESISRGSEKINEIVDAMLLLSKVTRSEISSEEVDLTALAREILAELKMQSPERNVDVAIAPELRLMADRSLLRAAMGNLIGNAWKYTGKNPDAAIEVGVETNGEEPVYFIRDNGIGFRAEEAERLFEAFTRLRAGEDFTGTGIGLAIVRRAITRLGGKLWAEAEPGKGATFFFTLPQPAPESS